MLSYTEAQNIIKSFARSFGKEKIFLDDALGRVLAEKVFADRDYPPFNRSAMDGYAIKIEDFEQGGRQLRIIDTVYAGSTTSKHLSSGECYKIMTGAAVPASANAVVRKEDCEQNQQSVSILTDTIKPFQNMARKGEDLQQSNLVLDKPAKCNASVIGVLTSLGKYEVIVEALPKVAIITTGNEVVDVHEPVNEVQIRNSNFYMVKALLKTWGIQPSYYKHVSDDPKEIFSAVEKALQYDIVIMNGGVSAGDADYVPSVLKELGVEQLLHKVAIRPGKPFWCGQKKGTMVFALPGNPLSCLVTFIVFIRSFLENCFGLSPSRLSLPIAEDRKQRVKLEEFFPVRIEGGPSQFYSVPFNGSGDIRLGFQAQAIAIHPNNKSELNKGEIVTAFLL